MKPFNTTDLPVHDVLPALTEALRTRGVAVLSAAPGAGKTTLVPPTLLEAPFLTDKIIYLLEPRRVAARAAARRIAALLDEPVGGRCGYMVRGDSRCSDRTRLFVVTEGIMLRKLQRDPFQEGVGAILFDEFHERNLDGDTALAFALDIRKNLNPELRLLIMSATLDLSAVSRVLGDAPVIDAPGRQFPVEIRWSENRLNPLRPVPDVARGTIRLYRESEGDLLVFLPGMREIDECARILTDALPKEALILKLHGSQEPREQDVALAPPPPGRRKVILATNVAESSITIDGVIGVVDSGLERRLRYNPAAGLSFLETVPISQASAAQRSGRAGRTAPGIALRLWNAMYHNTMPPQGAAEILEADLSRFRLEIAAWGTSPDQLDWIDAPAAANLRTAETLLRKLGAFDAQNQLTPRGRKLATLPVHPRIGMMLLRAKELHLVPLAAEIASILEERPDRRFHDADLTGRLLAFRRNPGDYRPQETIYRQLLQLLDEPDRELPTDRIGLLLAFAFPDWIARAREHHGRNYLLAGGCGGALPPDDDLVRHEFLAVAQLEGGAGKEPMIRLAAPFSEEELREFFSDCFELQDTVEFDPERERAFARRETRFGALILGSKPVDVSPEALTEAVVRAALSRNMPLPPEEEKAARRLLERVRFAARREPQNYPDWSADKLPENLLPFLTGVRSFRDLKNSDWLSHMQNALGYETLQTLNHCYPDNFTTPTGATHKIDYSGELPTLSVQIQELYGVNRHPCVGRDSSALRLELLSPARRPVQITTDLPGFWHGNWPLVQKEMKSRYPKHFWPDDPANESPKFLKRPKRQ